MATVLKIMRASLIEKCRKQEWSGVKGVKKVLQNFAESGETRSRIIITLSDGSYFELYMSEGGEICFLR